MEKLKSSG